MKSPIALLLVVAGAAASLMSCAPHSAATADPVALASFRADPLVVNGESTWVTHGRGYDLFGRTRADLAAVKPALDRASAFFGEIYPHDSVESVVATIRRMSSSANPVAAAPVPSDEKGARVEVVIVDLKAMQEERRSGRSSAGGERPSMERMQFGGLATPVVRAWLSARAARLSGDNATGVQAGADAADAHVPWWAVEMIDNAGNEQFIDNSTTSLAAHAETLIPLNSYFLMSRPEPMESAVDRPRPSGGPSGGAPPDRGGRGPGGRGGMGGRGGTGGGGGMGRSGGPGGSRGAPGAAGQRSFPLQGGALFAAQSAVLTKYFERTEADIVGAVIDAEIAGKPVDGVFAEHNLGSVDQVDADWRSWLSQRADMLNRH